MTDAWIAVLVASGFFALSAGTFDTTERGRQVLDTISRWLTR